MKERFDPRGNIGRGNQPEQPSQHKAERKQNVIAAYVGRAFRRHPLLFGLLIGYVLRQLFTGGFVFS